MVRIVSLDVGTASGSPACQTTVISGQVQPDAKISLNRRVTVDWAMTCLLLRSGR